MVLFSYRSSKWRNCFVVTLDTVLTKDLIMATGRVERDLAAEVLEARPWKKWSLVICRSKRPSQFSGTLPSS